MSLFVDCLLPGSQRPLRAEALAGQWATLADEDVDDMVAALVGTGPGGIGILLDGQQLAALAPPDRSRHGLAVVASRLPDMPALRVVDVVALGVHVPEPTPWQALLGTGAARAHNADVHARARAVAGRVGIAAWLDAPATDLSEHVQALVDLTRALAAAPTAVLWRRPDWLERRDQDAVAAALKAEQDHNGFAVVELTAVPAVA